MEEEKNEETNANVTEKKFDFWYFIPITILIVVVVVGTVFGIRFINNGKKEKLPKTYNYTRNSINKNSTNSNNNLFGPFEKPIIYIYPTKTTEVEVKLGNPEHLSCTYPKYENGWKVTANPDGSLIDRITGRKLYALYWEGNNIPKNINMLEGFCIKGEDTVEFLEEKLSILGLSDREAEEFIVYWLPKMEDNKYNFIRFETMEEQENAMPLEITPKPDNVIRIMMDWKAIDEKIEVEEQEFTTPSREGYTVVEWGGSEIE